MDWKQETRDLFKRGEYLQCLEVLEEKRKKTSVEENFIVDVNLIYLYEYIMVESTYSDDEFQFYLNRVKVLLEETYKQDEKNAKLLFYISYIASSYAEFYMGLTENDTSRMAYKALELEPQNPLYKWWIFFNYKGATYIQQKKLLANELLNKENYRNEIKRMLLVGDDLLNILRVDAFNLTGFE